MVGPDRGIPFVARSLSVHAPGGLIPIEWREDDEVVLTGRADLVYSGEWLG